MKKVILFIFMVLSLLRATVFAQSTASASWALTTDGTPITVGNVTASTLDPTSQPNSYMEGFAGYSFQGTTSPMGLVLGATGPTNWPGDGTTTSANSSLTGLSTGTVRFLQFSITPTSGNNLTINNISLQAAQSATAKTMYIAAGYSTANHSFTTFNAAGLTGNALTNVAGSFTTFSAAPSSLIVPNGDTVIVRVVLWRLAASAATTTSDILANVVISGSTLPATSPLISLSSFGPFAFGITALNTPTPSQSFTVSGSNLSNNVTVTPPTGFEIRTGTNAFSANAVTLTQSGGTLSATTVDVRFNPQFAAAFSGSVSCASPGALTQNVAVTGAALTYYYSKSSGNLDQTSTWTTDPNGGVGSSPDDFATDAQFFTIKNNPNPTIGSNWGISGSSSKLVVGDGTNSCVFTVPSAYTFSSVATEVTNNASFVLQDSASINSLNLTVDNGGIYQHDCNGASSTLSGTFLDGSTIKVTGVTTTNLWLPVNASNVIWNCPSQTANGKIYNSDATFSIKNLSVQSTGTGYCAINTGTGIRTLNISGNLDVQGGSFRLLGASTGTGATTINVSGNVTVRDSGVFNLSSSSNAAPAAVNLTVQGNFLHTAGTVTKTSTTGAASITFNGSTNQQFSTTGMGQSIAFVINNPAGVTLASTAAIHVGTVALTNGVLTTGLDTLIMGNNSPGALTRTNGWINGNVKRAFQDSIGSYLFPVGTANTYRGATVNFTVAPANTASLTAYFTMGDPGSFGLPDGISVYWKEGFWTISLDSIAGGVYSLSLDVNGINGVSSGDTKILQRATNSDAWSLAGTFSDITSGVITQTGISSFNQFTIGGDNLLSVKSGSHLPDHFQVYQNYPNPFNPSTVIAYDIPSESYVKVELYSIKGSRVAEISDGNKSAGSYSVTIPMNHYGLSSGVYFYKVSGYDLASNKSFQAIKKMVYLK